MGNCPPVIAHHSGKRQTHVVCLKVSKGKSLADNANYRGEKTAAEFLVNFMSKAPWPSGPPTAPVPSPRHPHSLPGAAHATSFFSEEDAGGLESGSTAPAGAQEGNQETGLRLATPPEVCLAARRAQEQLLVPGDHEGAPRTKTKGTCHGNRDPHPVPHPRHGVYGDDRGTSLPSSPVPTCGTTGRPPTRRRSSPTGAETSLPRPRSPVTPQARFSPVPRGVHRECFRIICWQPTRRSLSLQINMECREKYVIASATNF